MIFPDQKTLRHWLRKMDEEEVQSAFAELLRQYRKEVLLEVAAEFDVPGISSASFTGSDVALNLKQRAEEENEFE